MAEADNATPDPVGDDSGDRYEGLESSLEAEQDVIDRAVKRHAYALEEEEVNWNSAKEALRFRALEQWDETLKKEREDDGQPCLVMDKTNQHVNQIVNEGWQNPPGIKVRPKTGGARVEVAEVLQGMIRHIEDCSNADVAYQTAFEAAVDGGFGYWRYLTEYCDETSFEQDIFIRRIRNRFSVLLDPDRQEPDGSDAKWGFIFEKIDRKDFEAKYPGKDPIDFKSESARLNQNWAFEDGVLIAEYFCFEDTPYTIHLLQNGQTVSDEDYAQEDPMQIKPEIAQKIFAPSAIPGAPPQKVPSVKSRKTAKRQVVWRKITCREVLEKRIWAGKWIPIVEVVGKELDIEGESIKTGCITPAMDPQRVHNYASSSFVEHVALAPKNPWLADAEQIKGFESDWKTAHKRNISVLRYHARLEGNEMVPPPSRNQPAQPSPGWGAIMQFTEHDVQASLGRYAASLGEPSNERSGRAITARSRESDTGSYHFTGNYKRSMRFGGNILVDLIPKIFDTARITRIVKEDGELDQAMLDPRLKDQDGTAIAIRKIVAAGQEQNVYNLSLGTYDVSITSGPSYTTMRQEAADAMLEVLRSQPELIKIIGDLVFRNMDWPGANKIADRIQKTLPPALQDDKKNPLQAVVEQLQQQIQQMQQGQVAQKQHIDMFNAWTKRITALSEARYDEAKVREIASGIAQDIVTMMTPEPLPAGSATVGA